MWFGGKTQRKKRKERTKETNKLPTLAFNFSDKTLKFTTYLDACCFRELSENT